MAGKIHRYENDSILVTYDVERCLHAAECVRGRPEVFDPDSSPWVDPDAASADEIAEVITRCPTGALHFERKDGGAEEEPDERNTISIEADGPLLARGRLSVVTQDGSTVVTDTRIALCRCGVSKNKPYCDDSHAEAGFEAGGDLGEPKIRDLETADGDLRILLADDGPLILEGPVTLRGTDGEDRCSGTRAALCRCGASANKPFCDGSHAKVGFKS